MAGRAFLLRGWLLAAALLCAAAPARADIRLLGDWTYSWSEAETLELDTDEVTDTRSDRFRQLYRLDFSRQFTPTLLLNAGGLFERSDLETEIDGETSDFTAEIVRPYVDAELSNVLYTLGGGYRESAITNSGTGLQTTEQYVEEYDLRAEWQPVELPGIEAVYTHTERYTDPLTTDRETHIYRLTADYVYRHYDFLYTFLRSYDEQRLEETQSTTQTHNGRVRYARQFLDNRVTVNARVQAERSTVEFSGGGDRILRTLFPGTPFFISDDREPLFTPPEIISASPEEINLGTNGGTFPVSMGLAFPEETDVEMLRIRLSPTLSAQQRDLIKINESQWSWSIYTSNDQLNWELLIVNPPVNYDEVDNFFEIEFARETDVNFIKVVTTPLFDPTLREDLANIPILDIQAFILLPPEEGDEIVSISRNANFGVGWKVTDRTRVGYEAAYQDQEVEAFDTESRQLSNIFTLTHIFTPVYSGSARFLRNDRWREGEHDAWSNQVTGQLSALYLPTLRQSLTYSAEQAQEREGESLSQSVFLRTNAELYPGWDASFDQGYTWQDQAEQGELSSFFVRLASSVVPHRRVSFLFDYAVRWTWQEDREDRRDQTGRLRGFWSPTDAFSLFGEIGVRETVEDTFMEWEYGVGWLPLRDGTLQVNVRYSEEGDTDDELIRSFSPSVNWAITRNAFLTLTYTLGRQEDRNEETDFQSAQANLRIFYD